MLKNRSMPKFSLELSRKILLIVLVTSIAIAGTVAGLVFIPGSPGLPYLNPTSQAEKASFQQQSQNSLGTVYEVWYDQPRTGETNTSLTIVLSANSPSTHFNGVSTAGVNSPYGNFSATVGTGKTWLVLPIASCPVTPDTNVTELVVLHADSPVGQIVFSFKCSQNPGTLVLGNPHIVISQLIHQSCTIGVDLGPVYFVDGNTATVWVHNMWGCNVSPTSYYVMDQQGDIYYRSSWTTVSIPSGPGVALTVLIGSACPSCTLAGNSFNFQYVNRYVILLVTSSNMQFRQTTGTTQDTESIGMVSYAIPSNTNVTLLLENLGSTTITLVSYTINDTNGNYWHNQAWNPGSIIPGGRYTANIAVGYGPGGCGTACTYTGTPGAFDTVRQGTQYTVRLFSQRGDLGTFTF